MEQSSQIANNSQPSAGSPRLTIRIGKNSLSFSAIEQSAEESLLFQPFTVKSGISMAANLRQAFQECGLLQRQWQRARVLVDAPVIMIPLEEFEESDYEICYRHCLTGHDSDEILYNVLPSLNAIAVFSMNKDLKMVISDHIADAKYEHVCSSVWRHLHRRSFTGTRKKLYGYFHDRQLCIFQFAQHRFRFVNSYDVTRAHNAVYYLLYVWKQLALNQQKDELHLVGDIPEKEELQAELHKYLQNVYIINPVADFNRAPLTNMKGLPYDLMTFYLGK